MLPTITTPRLTLTPVDLPTYEAIFAGMPELSRHLNLSVPHEFSIFGLEPFQYVYDKLKANPQDLDWWLYLFISPEQQALAGVGGYKGPPDKQGMVEIGYSIYEDFQNQGLATETAQALIEQAFAHPEISLVQAHTLAEENASVRVLKKCGMTFTGEFDDPDDGLIWQWQIRRNRAF
ncbi:GNAT family N-acetyltransferase [Spirosoma areae]